VILTLVGEKYEEYGMYIWLSSMRNSILTVLSSLNAQIDVTTLISFVSGSCTRFRTTAMRHSDVAGSISTSRGSSSLIWWEYSVRVPRLGGVSQGDRSEN